MSEPLIELDHVHFAYDAARVVHEDVDLTLHAGERLFITGPNGGGKTTLLQLIVGLVKPLRGSVRVFGEFRETEPDFKEVRKAVGYVFQDSDAQLFCPTVYEDVAFGPLNLGLPKNEVEQRVSETLESLNLAAYRDRVTYRLSNGEKRLVALATVLAMRPRVLLLDEPTNGLDERHAARLIEILTGLPQEMIVVSHDRDFIDQVATRVVELRDGRIFAAQSV